jgi:hypothetical protein
MQGFDDQKFKILTAEKIFKFFLDQFTIFLSIELHTGFPSFRRSLQPSK